MKSSGVVSGHLKRVVAPLTNPIAQEYVKKLPEVQSTIAQRQEKESFDPFPGYSDGLIRSVVERGKGPVYRELPIQERLSTRKAYRCPLCPGHPITGIMPKINELVETNVELLAKFVNSRGMIMPKKNTGVCAKHQRKLAATIKRARHLGFLSFTRGPDDFFNVGPESFDEKYIEYGQKINPVHRDNMLDSIALQQAKDKKYDQFGQLKSSWQLDSVVSSMNESLPELSAETREKYILNKGGFESEPIKGTDEHYRPPTFHMVRLALAHIKPKPRPKIVWVDGNPEIRLIKPKPNPYAGEPVEDAIEKFGPDEVYADEASLLGKPMPLHTRRQIAITSQIKDAIERARKGQTKPTLDNTKAPWLIQMEVEREKLQIAMEVQRVARLEKKDEDLDWDAIAAEVQVLSLAPTDLGLSGGKSL